jgi:aminoglycoside 3-N-acetyltransferase
MIIKELKEVLKNKGIKKKDTVCVFSDITSFGIPQMLKEKIKEKGMNFLLDSYIETFQDLIGKNGLLLMPTFTYSATNNEVYDVQKTKSTVGVLTEYFRKKDDVVRSLHPIFSFAAWGKKAPEIIKIDDWDSFGPKSVMGKLDDLNAMYVLFGVGMHDSATFVLYSEQKHKTYYRYFKRFPAKIINGNKQINTDVNYYVRNLDINYDYSWENLESKGK